MRVCLCVRVSLCVCMHECMLTCIHPCILAAWRLAVEGGDADEDGVWAATMRCLERLRRSGRATAADLRIMQQVGRQIGGGLKGSNEKQSVRCRAEIPNGGGGSKEAAGTGDRKHNITGGLEPRRQGRQGGLSAGGRAAGGVEGGEKEVANGAVERGESVSVAEGPLVAGLCQDVGEWGEDEGVGEISDTSPEFDHARAGAGGGGSRGEQMLAEKELGAEEGMLGVEWERWERLAHDTAVCVCGWVWVWVWMGGWLDVCVCVPYSRTDRHHILPHTCTPVSLFMYVGIDTYTYTYTCTCAYKLQVRLDMRIGIHMHIHIHEHAYMHAYRQTDR